MRASGQVLYTRLPDGSVTHQWRGGGRIAITSELIRALTKLRPHVGQVIELPDLTMRLVDLQTGTSAACQDTYIAMREGLLARVVAGYTRWLHRQAATIFAWECRWLRWREPVGGESYPKWSIVGLLIRPLM